MPAIALALLAHPDDAEMLCAGTLIQIAQQPGWSVAIATMTPGDCGSAEHSSEEIARIRQSEAAAAARLINADYQCLGCRDLQVFYNAETLASVTRFLRRIRPSLVITHSPNDYHLDHENTSQLVRAATFAAPVPLYLPDIPPIERVPHLYYCDPVDGVNIFGEPITPNMVVNITSDIELKARMLACHASQRNWLLKHHGVDHYIEAMRAWSARRGASANCAFGEGFRQHLGHGYPTNNLLASLCTVT
jgi:LmbE family N-acetylglucosaminyl deacetylase